MDATPAWDDLRVLFAVARFGSHKRAAKALAVDPATVSRRIAALEELVGQPLLRVAGGKRVPTEAGARLVAIAERMQHDLVIAQRELGESEEARGVVRVSTVDVVATAVLGPALRAMRKLHPHLILEVIATPTVLDLTRGDADVAVRITKPKEDGLVRKRLASLDMRLFAHPKLLERCGIDARAPGEGGGDGAGLPIVEYTGALTAVPETEHVRALLPRAEVVHRTTSVASVMMAVLAAQAAGVVPGAMLPPKHGLSELAIPPPPSRDVWLVVPPAARKVPRVRAACEAIELAFDRMASRAK
jgi:DNA-binding transcriptional LysR family regulator